MNESHAFCQRCLPEVSRTFALNIPVLPEPLDMAVTVAYLLCRIADTLEDEIAGHVVQRADLFAELVTLTAAPAGVAARAKAFATSAAAALRAEAPAAEVKLLQNADVVLEALATLPEWTLAPIARCVRVMSQGMAQVMRQTGNDTSAGLPNLEATRRYCYFVAGVVGEMLTELFAAHSPSVSRVQPMLEQRAVAFGNTLQLTNILKDVREDLERGSCWLPKDRMRAHGVSAQTLLEPSSRGAAVALLDELVEVALTDAREALEYSLTLPAQEPQLRLFCLWPLFFAVLTLRTLRGNADVFSASPVKISRDDVRWVMSFTSEHASDDATLRGLFDSLVRGEAVPAAERLALAV